MKRLTRVPVMEKEALRATVYSRIDEIPTLPAIIPKLLRMVEDEMTGSSDVARVVAQDPALTSKILRVANSAYYGFPQEISTLESAVRLLGFNMVRSLALSMGVINLLPSVGSFHRFSGEGLWVHSLAVATAMERIRGKKGHTEGRDYLVIVGLLHDTGKIILMEFFQDLFLQALEETENPETPWLYEAERRVLGFDHGEVGSMLLSRWRFPTVICRPIANHHRGRPPEDEDRQDTALLRVADCLGHAVGMGEVGNLRPPAFDRDDLEILGIQESDLEDARSHLVGSRERILDFFRALT